MVNSTKIFTFDNRNSATDFTFSILNVTLNNDFYNFAPLGAKSIREEKVSGRDLPYFYDTDLEVMSFKMTIAFEDFVTQSEVGEVIKWLFLPKTPRLLRFQEHDLNYFGTFIGEPRFHYIGNNLDGFEFIGYIEVEFRANAPYGWTNLIVDPVFDYVITSDADYTGINPTFVDGDIVSVTNNLDATDGDNDELAPGIYTFLNGQQGALFPGIRATHEIINTGDIEILPSFTLTNLLSNTTVDVVLTSDSITFSYRLAGAEVLTFNGYTKIFSSSVTQNPYPAWNINIPKDYLYFEPGSNIVTMADSEGQGSTYSGSVAIAYSFRAPKIL